MTAKFSPGDTVDFVVVGSGAAGGVMARELAQSGFSVVVLEQGPRLAPSDFEVKSQRCEIQPESLQGFARDRQYAATKLGML